MENPMWRPLMGKAERRRSRLQELEHLALTGKKPEGRQETKRNVYKQLLVNGTYDQQHLSRQKHDRQ